MKEAKTDVEINCAWCEEILDEEEAGAPRTDSDGDPICDDCWYDEYTFQCCLCKEYDHVNVQHFYLVVGQGARGWRADVTPGIYYVKCGPYHGGSMFRGHLFDDNLLRLRDIPNGSYLDTYFERYPVGHLCRTCVGKLNLATTAEYRKECEKADI